MKILVCDVGFGYTKFIAGKTEGNEALVLKEGCFPSVVRRLLSSSFFQIEDHPDFIKVEDKDNSKTYLVGFSAVDAEKGVRVRNSEFFLEIFPLLLKRVFKELEEDPEILVIGTPFQEWTRLKDEFVNLAKDFIENVACFPQAASAACLLGKSSFNSLIVDIGYNTTDIVPVDEKGRILSDRGISWEKTGISLVLEDLENLIKGIFGFGLNSFQIENFFIFPSRISRISPVLKKWKDNLLEFRDKAIEEYAHLLSAKLVDRFGRNKKLVLAGGGAKILARPLKKRGWKITIMKNPQFANARGFFKLGLAKTGFTGRIVWDLNNYLDEEKNKNPEKENIFLPKIREPEDGVSST